MQLANVSHTEQHCEEDPVVSLDSALPVDNTVVPLERDIIHLDPLTHAAQQEVLQATNLIEINSDHTQSADDDTTSAGDDHSTLSCDSEQVDQLQEVDQLEENVQERLVCFKKCCKPPNMVFVTEC